MSASLADKIQVWGFEDDNIIYTDGSVGFMLDILPVDVSCWNSSQSNDFTEKISQFLNGLPEKVSLQFIQEIKSGNDLVLKENEELLKGSSNKLVQEIGQVRLDFYKSLDENGELPIHGLKLIVRQQASKPLIKKTSLFSKSSLFPKMSEDGLARELKKLEQLKANSISSLESMGLPCKPLSAAEVTLLMYDQWNPCRKQKLDNFDTNDVRNTLLFTDVAASDSGFKMGEMYHKILSLKLLPGQTHSMMANQLRELPFDSKLNVTIDVPNTQKEIESLQLQRRLAFAMVYGKTSGVSDIESTAKLEDLENLLAEMIAQGEKVFHVGINVLLRSKSEDALDDMVSQTILKFRELSGAEAMEESLASFDVFTEIALPHARCKERTKRLKTSNLADLLPLYGPWVGHAEPKVLLRSRMGSLVKFNPFSKELTNANQVISGGSGSGKSFLTNLLLIQMLKEDPQIFIVDIGGSYKKTCENLSGQYIPLGVDHGISINPFDLAEGGLKPSNEKIKFLLALIETITKEDGAKGLEKLQRSELENAISKVYEDYKKPRLSNLKSILLDHEDLQMVKLGKILSIWCGETPYGRFLDKPTTVEMSNSTICFDLKGLEQYEDLQQACLLMISDMVVRSVQNDKTRMKFLVFDECWRLLEDGEGANFIGSIFRTCRKYFMSCIAISQNIDDFALSPVAKAIMSNSSIKWVLKQKGSDKDRLAETLELNESEIDLISSLHQERGVYSEAFLICEDNRAVVAVESTPPEYWLATTDPRDIGELEKQKKLNPDFSREKLILYLADKYPNGTV